MATEQDDTDVIATALKRFQRAVEATAEQCKRELEDLNFEFDPWPDPVKKARAGYEVSGVPVPARPMVNIPMLDQPIQLVINQEKAAHLGIEVHPETEDADDETADVLQGIIRDIEVRSRANLARSWAFERAVKCGRGFYRILKRFCTPNAEGPEAFDQELVVERILNQGCVYFDPEAIQPDNSDAMWAFIVQGLSKDAYIRQFGESKLASMDRLDLEGLGDDVADWLKDESYRIAEYFTVEITKRTKIAYDLGEGTQIGWEDELPKDLPKDAILNKRELETRTVRWRKINAVEVLEEVVWDGQYIPIITVIGREFNINGVRRWTGVVSQAKDSARLVNYAAATVVEKVAIDTKATYVIAEGQEEGHEAEFARAAARPVPYLRYKPVTVAGQMAPPPERNIAGPNIQADIALLQEAKDFVHSSTFAFDASLGNLPQKDRSGKAIQALQQQSDAGNSHYLDNLAEVSMTYEAKVHLDMIPKVYDRPGRMTRIVDTHDEDQNVLLNQPFVPGEDGKPQAVAQQPGQPLPPKAKHYDLTKGAYGVVVNVGKSYQTRMQQGSDALGQLLQADPALMPIIGWRYFKYNDNIPGHNEIADDLKKLRPPQLQDENDPANAQQQLAQTQAQLQQVSAAAQEMGKALETEKVKHESAEKIAAHRDLTTLAKTHMDNETKITVAELQALAKELQDTRALFMEERARLGVQRHEHALAAADAGHEQMMAERQHEQALEQGAQGIVGGMAQAEQGQGHALEQMAAQPQPEAGA